MYHIGICGEVAEDLFPQGLSWLELKDNVKLVTREWTTCETLMEELTKGRELDVLFMNLDAVKTEGIRTGKWIREELKDQRVHIIYRSDRECFSREMIQTMPFDYLTRGRSGGDAENALERAILSLKRGKENFEFKYGRNYYSVPFRDIVYVCSDRRRVRVKTEAEEFEFNGLLRDVKEFLPKEFLVIHKSFIINRDRVLHYTYETVRLSDGTTLPISKVNRSRVKAALTSGR